MVTYDAMNMLFQFGIFLTSTLTVVVAVIAFAIKQKK
ncbi:putative holin-like toxin [Indiicoccus explosivorum]|nr:putative holin-like toxin [Indiicoccus explosivorum]